MTITEKSKTPALIALIALGMALRAVFMTKCFFDPEELIEINVVMLPSMKDFIEAADLLTKGYIDLFYIRFLYSINSSEMFLRSGELLLNLAFMIIAWRTLRELTKSAEAALLGMVIIVLSPIHTYYSCILRYHNFTFIFTALSILYFRRIVLEEYRPVNVVMYGATTALACMAHYYGFFLIAAQCATYLVFKLRKPAEWPRMIVGVALSFVFFLPWLPIFIRHLDRRAGDVASTVNNIGGWFSVSMLNVVDVFFQFITGIYFDLHVKLPIARFILFSCFVFLAICAAVFALMLFRRKLTQQLTFCITLLGAMIFAAYIGNELTSMSFNTKFLIPYSILFYAVLAMVVTSMKPAWLRGLAILAMLVPLVSSQANLQKVSTDPLTTKNMLIKAAEESGDADAVIAVGVKCGRLYDYYTGAGRRENFRIWNAADKSWVHFANYYDVEGISLKSSDDLARFMEGREKAWVLYCVMGMENNMDVFNRRYDPDGILFEWFGENAEQLESINFKTSPRVGYFMGRLVLYGKKNPQQQIK